MAKHLDETQVERTTPQGTQERGVTHGHELRDINIASVMRWFAVVAAVAVVSMLLMWGMFAGFAFREGKKDRLLPSQIFATKSQQPPPGPKLLPEPWESLEMTKAEEQPGLVKHGLVDERTGRSKLPANAEQLIATENAGATSPGDAAGAATASDLGTSGDSSGGRFIGKGPMPAAAAQPAAH